MRLDYKTKDEHDGACVNSSKSLPLYDSFQELTYIRHIATCNIKFSTGTILRSDLDYGNPDLVIFEDVMYVSLLAHGYLHILTGLDSKRIRLNYGSKDNWCGEYECHILQEPVPIP